jgi:hypothetical protein
VKKARQLLDNRGIDEEFCRRVFNDLQAEEVWVGAEGEYVPNIVDYDVYKLFLKEQMFRSSQKTMMILMN